MAKKRGIQQYLELEYLTETLILKNLGFILFMGFLFTIAIANAHYAEGNVRRIQQSQKELKELRWYYMTLEAENMYNSRRTEMGDRLRAQGLEAFPTQPKRIVVDKSDY